MHLGRLRGPYNLVLLGHTPLRSQENRQALPCHEFGEPMIESSILFLLMLTMITNPTVPRSAKKVQENEASIVTVAVSPRQADMVLRQPLDIALIIHNAGRQPAALDLGSDRKTAITVKAQLPDGTVTVAHVPPHGDVSRRGLIALAPDQTYLQNLIINQWMKFPVPGPYHIMIFLDNPVRMSDGSTFRLDPATLQVNVGKRDVETLNRFCDSQLNKLLAAKGYEAAAHEAEPLSAVEDSVAIPYLLRAFQSPYHLDSMFVDALEKIGSADAIEGLLQMIGKEPSSQSEYLRNALNRLAAKTMDPNLRHRILTALEDK